MSAFDDAGLLSAVQAYVRVCGGDPAKSTPYDERDLERKIDIHSELELEAAVESATALLDDQIETLGAEASESRDKAEQLRHIIDAARAALEAS